MEFIAISKEFQKIIQKKNVLADSEKLQILQIILNLYIHKGHYDKNSVDPKND